MFEEIFFGIEDDKPEYTPGLGIGYMGSKKKIAKDLCDFILKENPNCKYFYDLFGGGGAMSFDMLQRPQIKSVFYNELNTGVVELLKDIKENGITEKYYQWISRETFFENRDKDTWLGGLCKTIWSFGNCQRTYLFNKDLEPYKKAYHEVVVNSIDNLEAMADYCEKYVYETYGVKHRPKLTMPTKKDYQERRLEMRKQLTVYENECKAIQKDVGALRRLQRLQQLQQLERLQQLQQLEQLNISNLSYDEVKITTPIEETIIYLDPPYIGTEEYQKKIDHDTLYNYIRSSPYKIYLSSYVSELPEVFSIKHSTTLAQKTRKETYEKLFCNKVEGK